MDHYELGVAMAVVHLAERRRQAVDRAGGGRAAPAAASGRGRGTTEAAMLVQHHHDPGAFDADHCWACARQAGLLDHYRRVQQQEAALREAHGWARVARQRASVALWSSGAALLLAAIALLSG
jgi:hypothetical protein